MGFIKNQIKNKILSLVLPLMLAVAGCTSTSITLGEIDIEQWKKDKAACNAYRTNHISQLEIVKNNLLRYGERDITLTLGIPERTELYEKSQKFYFYQLTPDPSCNQNILESRVLRLRFTAMGYCHEALILNE